MLSRIIEWSLRNQFLIVVAALASIVGGIWSIQQTRLDAIPDLSDTQVIIYSRWDRSPDISYNFV